MLEGWSDWGVVLEKSSFGWNVPQWLERAQFTSSIATRLEADPKIMEATWKWSRDLSISLKTIARQPLQCEDRGLTRHFKVTSILRSPCQASRTISIVPFSKEHSK
jgi:hypothetical protein